MRRVIAICLTITMASALGAGSVAAQAEGPPVVPDTLRAFSITPPGQDGTVTAAQFTLDNFGPHYDDQLEMYAALIDDDDVTEEELGNYFHPMQFGPGEDAGDPYEPGEGVTVYRDSFGIPHVYGDSLASASFGLGYVTAEDRLFQMDIFRNAARGTLAGFAGPGEDDARLQMDIDTRREGYTEEEIQAMFDALDDKFGEQGAAIQSGLQSYTDGVNAYMDEHADDPMRRPFEYEGTGNPPPGDPEPWEVSDTLFLVVLQLREFGETAGGELQNAGLYSHLQGKLGRKPGRRTYDELFFQNDPRSPLTISPDDASFSTQDLGPLDPSSVAIPDNAPEVAQRVARREASRRAILEGLGFKKPASNALLVSADKSATGNPLLLGGPQVGHALPSFFMDIDVHAPGIDFRGPAVPGASALVPLGRGADYAWTLTTGYSDAVDTRAELLCDPEGGEPTLKSNAYVFKGDCVEMTSREETFEVKPPPTDPGPSRTETRTFYRTQHGPVFQRAMVGGKPAAFVKERYFWMKEIDSLPSFYKWNAEVDSIEDFAAAAKGFTMSFNAFYADHDNVGYFHVGEYPQRAKGVHPSLPTWGTGQWEWKGRRSYSRQPKIINPGQGWVANWNNKPAAGWANQDSLKWGSIQRVELLSGEMHELLDGRGKASLSDVVNVMRQGATRDARGVYLGPAMLRKAAKKKAGQPAEYASALTIVSDWVAGGAHRKNAERGDTMDEGAALAIFDRWYDKLAHAVFDDEIGADGYPLFPDAPITNYNPRNGGGFFFDFSTYLRNLFNRRTRLATYKRNYCNNISTEEKETCVGLIAATLVAALAELKEEQGDDPAAWTTPAENISFTNNSNSTSAGSVGDIPWQNRGTENHIVEVLGKAE